MRPILFKKYIYTIIKLSQNIRKEGCCLALPIRYIIYNNILYNNYLLW